MNRFYELLEKRKNLTATIFEEEELIELSKTLPSDKLATVDPNWLTYSNGERLDSLVSSLDKLLAKLNKEE